MDAVREDHFILRPIVLIELCALRTCATHGWVSMGMEGARGSACEGHWGRRSGRSAGRSGVWFC